MLDATSTKWAPWWVIPADHKWVCRALVSTILKLKIDGLKLKPPTVDDRRRAQLAEMRKGVAASSRRSAGTASTVTGERAAGRSPIDDLEAMGSPAGWPAMGHRS